MSWRNLAVLPLAALVACSSPDAEPTTTSKTNLTYFQDIQPIVEQHCASCHTEGGIAPFTLEDYAAVAARRVKIAEEVGSRQMPPWPPDDACTSYKGDRSMSDTEVAAVLEWANGGAPAGVDPSVGSGNGSGQGSALSRTDLTAQMPAAYTPPSDVTDDYRCFLVDWPETTDTFITGFEVHPGNPRIVHHVIAFAAMPGDVAAYEAIDGGDGRLGYSCFGGPGAGDVAGWVGAWAPGTLTADFPANTGIAMPAGSKLIIQVHYNVLNGPGESDLTQLAFKIDPTVAKPAFVLPWADPAWVNQGRMPIPAGEPDAGHAWDYDPSPYMAYLSNGVIQANAPYTIYSAAGHMHLRGKRETLTVERADGGDDCMLDIPQWDFHWQGSYLFKDPKVVNPGDKLKIACRWDNSAANQPWVGGKQLAPTDLNWGEGTGDEMCLGIFYITQ